MSALVPVSVQSSSKLKDLPAAPTSFRDAYAKHTPRVALVTGAAQGIGRGISLRLVRDGYKVALVDLASQLEALAQLRSEIITGGEDEEERAVVILADVSKEEDVQHMVDCCVEKLGGLDVVSSPPLSLFCVSVKISFPSSFFAADYHVWKKKWIRW